MYNLIIGILIFILSIPIIIRFGIWFWHVKILNPHKTNEKVPWTDITVRIITIGNNTDIIQNTVDSISKTNAEIQIISEKDINIKNADAFVIDEEFTCKATGKGRALEWARRNLPKRDYILFLNEDCELTYRTNIPKGDQVQLRQNPKYTNSLLAWYAEIQRVGVGEETYSFDKLNPKYIWGGGLLVKSDIEDKITWNANCINEDTEFIYEAIDNGFEYTIVREPQVNNLSPLSFSDILQQRREWNSNKDSFITRFKKTLDIDGSIIWIINSLFPILLLLTLMIGNLLYLLLIVPLYIINLIWIFYGLNHIKAKNIHYVMVMFLTPIIAFYNGIGNLYALLYPKNNT